MGRLSLEQKVALVLTPAQEEQLRKEFGIYREMRDAAEDAERDRETSKGILDRLREELGVKSVSVAGAGIVTVISGGTSRSLNLKALMKTYGITPKQLASYYVEKPKKGHVLVTLPGDEEKAAKAKAAKKAMRDERDEDDREDE